MVLPAKLRMPVVSGRGLLPRERLFAMLDANRSTPALWISGPPGAGKTVLIQTWLQARRPFLLWYRVDRADADPALLPQGLRTAASHELGKVLGDRLPSFPALTPDRRGSIAAFASDFFWPLFEAMAEAQALTGAARATHRPAGQPVLVFDNLDEALHSPDFCHLLSAAIECAEADRVRIVCIARTEPHGHFARLLAHERLAAVPGAQLRATDDEAMALIDLRRRKHAPTWPASEVAHLNARCDGWISGLVLASSSASGLPAATQARSFTYLAATMLDGQTDERHQLLLACALMPTFTARMAAAVSGQADAGAVLAALAEANLFVSERARSRGWEVEPPIYEFHALLREFLLARGRERWPESLRAQMLRLAADQLAADGQVEACAAILIEVGNWPALAALVRAHAPALIESGRHETLAAWLASLPADQFDSDPWLAYWSGQCSVLFDPPSGCKALEQAFAGFAAAGNHEGQLLAWCSIVESITLEWRDFSVLDGWIGQADRLLSEHPFESLAPGLAQRTACAMLSALMWRQSWRSDLPLWYLRARDAVLAMDGHGARVAAGVPVVIFEAVHTGDHRALDNTYARLRSNDSLARQTPMDALIGCIVDATYAWMRGRCDEAVDHVRRGRSLRETHGIALPGYLLTSHEVYARATAGQFAQAAAALAEARANDLDPARRLDVDNAEYQAALIALECHRPHEALSIVHATAREVGAAGGPLHAMHDALAEAQVLHELGETAAARQRIDVALQDPRRPRGAIFDFQALACLSLFDIDNGADPREHLKAAFEIGARCDILNYLWFRPAMFAKLCARALELGIEREYAQRLVEQRRLQPPYVSEAWPWPVRLCCWGSAEPRLWVHGQPVEGRRSSPDAPLRLLLAIVALSREVTPRALEGCPLPVRPVDRAQLGRQLRPNDPAASVDDWIHQNLKRLRQRLGLPEVVLSWAGRLALNPTLVWVDVLDGSSGGSSR